MFEIKAELVCKHVTSRNYVTAEYDKYKMEANNDCRSVIIHEHIEEAMVERITERNVAGIEHGQVTAKEKEENWWDTGQLEETRKKEENFND